MAKRQTRKGLYMAHTSAKLSDTHQVLAHLPELLHVARRCGAYIVQPEWLHLMIAPASYIGRAQPIVRLRLVD